MDDTVRYHGGEFYRVFDPLYTFAYNTVLVDKKDAPTSWQDRPRRPAAPDLRLVECGAGEPGAR
ncbi:hypothetical protein BBN63_07275 [Streptomyces niveus]|uniref:Uncharacterized protein n=1 Tax=Streptomyces niveus TaxID=193462 RepID=A0A1U9QQK1_STRNV|nr:hypothetical protein BBN63_07275 [Streptomyces niveus]